MNHCTKNDILFFQMFWKCNLSIKIALEYDLSCIIKKYDVSFSRKYDLILQIANERWSLSKKYMEILYFLQMFWKDGLSKKIILEYDLSCIIWKHGFLLPESMIFFIWTQNERRSFSRNTWKYKCYKYDIIPLPKNSKTIFPQEYTLKDWDSRLIF